MVNPNHEQPVASVLHVTNPMVECVHNFILVTEIGNPESVASLPGVATLPS